MIYYGSIIYGSLLWVLARCLLLTFFIFSPWPRGKNLCSDICFGYAPRLLLLNSLPSALLLTVFSALLFTCLFNYFTGVQLIAYLIICTYSSDTLSSLSLCFFILFFQYISFSYFHNSCQLLSIFYFLFNCSDCYSLRLLPS